MPIVEATEATTSPANSRLSAPSPTPASGHSVARTNNDAKSLLLELARALRGFSFYDETAPQRRSLVDRAYRALRRKYGWQMMLLDLFSRLAGKIDARALLELEAEPEVS
jgi:hypothetical protein